MARIGVYMNITKRLRRRLKNKRRRLRSKYYKKYGFTIKCRTCQCFNCGVDYGKLVGAPGWASVLCKYGINLCCYTCRERGGNTMYINKESPLCPNYVEEE